MSPAMSPRIRPSCRRAIDSANLEATRVYFSHDAYCSAFGFFSVRAHKRRESI